VIILTQLGLPTSRADGQDGASSWHCMEICWEKGWPAASRPDELS